MRRGDSRGLENLRSVLRTLCLRRTRDILPLPEIKDNPVELEISAVEKEVYSRAQAEARRAVDYAISNSCIGGVMQGILILILQLRLICNHGAFGISSSPTDQTFEVSDSLSLLK